MANSTDRLLSQLNQTQLAQKDNPVYQVIKQLIGIIKNIEVQTGISSSTTIENITQITQQLIIEEGGGDGDPGPPGIRGIDGAAGATGAQGPPFPALIYLESDLPEDVLPIPGPQGPQGVAGATGVTGSQAIGFVLEAEPPDAENIIQIVQSPVVSGSSWTLIDTRNCSATANEDFTNLSSYNEIFVILQGITKATTGLTSLRVSTDNGATFLAASGDYLSIAGTGITSVNTLISCHITNATAARSGFARINNFNGSASPKFAFSQTGGTLPDWIIPTNTALNAIRILGSAGGNLTGGTIYVFGR